MARNAYLIYDLQKGKSKAIPFPRAGTHIGLGLQECYRCPRSLRHFWHRKVDVQKVKHCPSHVFAANHHHTGYQESYFETASHSSNPVARNTALPLRIIEHPMTFVPTAFVLLFKRQNEKN